MAPYPAPVAAKTTLWLGPWIIATQFNKFLDIHRKTDYHLIAFITDFSEEDDSYEQFLRNQGLKYFLEPVIYAGRAEAFKRRCILTDYQANCCA